jgi:YbbR domain-containing protein
VKRLVRLVVYNWPLKFAAIVLASLLYAGLVVSQSTFELPAGTQVPIHTVNQPVDAVLLTTLPPVTRIRYVSSGDTGAPATPGSFSASIDLSGVNPEAGSTYVSVDVTAIDPRFLVVDWEPRGINVQLDPYTSKVVPVQVKWGTPPDNLDIRQPVLSASEVTVSGPDSVVKFVVAAQANVLIDPQGLPIDRDVSLIPVDILGNARTPIKIDPPSVHVQIAVFSNRKTKPVAVNPIVTGTPPSGYVVDTIAVDPPIVSVEGDPAELSTVTRADTQAIAIGGVTGSLEVDVPLALPSGVLPIGPQTVHVTITVKPELGTRTFSAGVVLTGQQTGFDYGLTPGFSQVTIGGPVADLDRLDPASFTVSVDVNGLAPGSHVVDLTPNLQAGLRLVSVDPSTVTITVSGPGGPTPVPSGG